MTNLLIEKETESTVVAIQPNLQDVVSETPVIYSALLLSEFLILIKRGLMPFTPPPGIIGKGSQTFSGGYAPGLQPLLLFTTTAPREKVCHPHTTFENLY